MARSKQRKRTVRGDLYLRRAHVSKRNQNKRKRTEGLPLPSPWMIVGTALVIAGLTYVSLIARCEALGRDIKILDTEIADRERILQNEQAKWTRMRAPENIDRALAAFNISMALPQPHQVVRVVRRPQNENAFFALLREQGGSRIDLADVDHAEIHD